MVVMFISSKEKNELFARIAALEARLSMLTETINYLETGEGRKRRKMSPEQRAAASLRMKEWHANKRRGAA